MNAQSLYDLMAKIAMLGGDPLDEVLAPSEIRLIAEVIAQAFRENVLPHLSVDADLPSLDFLFQEAPFEASTFIGTRNYC